MKPLLLLFVLCVIDVFGQLNGTWVDTVTRNWCKEPNNFNTLYTVYRITTLEIRDSIFSTKMVSNVSNVDSIKHNDFEGKVKVKRNRVSFYYPDKDYYETFRYRVSKSKLLFRDYKCLVIKSNKNIGQHYSFFGYLFIQNRPEYNFTIVENRPVKSIRNDKNE
jgi:hypothetical protein